MNYKLTYAVTAITERGKLIANYETNEILIITISKLNLIAKALQLSINRVRL